MDDPSIGHLDHYEEAIARRLFATEPGDPLRPFLVDDDQTVQQNPLFQRRIANLEPKNFGTSFFVNFDQDCVIKDEPGEIGKKARLLILKKFLRTCNLVLSETMGQMGIAYNTESIECLIDPKRTCTKNGEMYFWIPGLNLSEDQAFETLRNILRAFRQNPVTVPNTDDNGNYIDVTVSFIGWGVRSYSF